MKSKLEILARLLKEDKITVDEFVILSTRDIEYIYKDRSDVWKYPHITFTPYYGTTTEIPSVNY